MATKIIKKQTKKTTTTKKVVTKKPTTKKTTKTVKPVKVSLNDVKIVTPTKKSFWTKLKEFFGF